MSAISAATRPTPLSPARPRTVAAAAASVGLSSLLLRGISAHGLLLAAFAAVLVWLAAIDLEHRLVPNRIVLPAAAVMLAAQIALTPRRAPEWLAASIGAAAFFLVLALVKPGALGMGDVKLMLLLGAGFGAAVLPVLTIGCFAAAVFVCGLVGVHGKAAFGRYIPFAPFLAFGAIVGILAGVG